MSDGKVLSPFETGTIAAITLIGTAIAAFGLSKREKNKRKRKISYRVSTC